MSTYKGKTHRVAQSGAHIAEKFADLTVLENLKDQLPADQAAQLGQLSFEPDSIVVNTPQLGQVRFQITRRDPQGIRFEAAGTPIPLLFDVALDPVDADTTDLTTSVDVDIPAMLRPFVGGKINQMVDSLGQIIAKIAEQ